MDSRFASTVIIHPSSQQGRLGFPRVPAAVGGGRCPNHVTRPTRASARAVLRTRRCDARIARPARASKHAENAKSDSECQDKLDRTKIASMGYSMGALATTMIGGEARWATTVHVPDGNLVTDRIKLRCAPVALPRGARCDAG